MARNITVTFEDGTSHVYNNAPDDVTPDAVEARAAKEFGKRVTALDGGRAAAPKPTGADAIPGQRSISKAEPEPSMQDRIMGAIETPIALGAGAIGGLVSPVAGLAGSLFSGKYGTPEGVRAGEEVARQVQSQFYQPRTQTAQQALKTIGSVAEPLIGVPIPTLNALTQSAPAATRAIRDVARSEANLVGGAIAAPLEARAARIQESRVAESYARAPIIDAAQSAQRQGFAVNPAITNPTLANRSKAMIVGPAFDEAAAKFNAEKTTNVVRKDLGVAANEKLDSFAVDRALDKASAPYAPIKEMPVLKASDDVLASIKALDKPATLGGKAQAKVVTTLIDDAIQELQDGRSGLQILDDIRQMRRQAQSVYKSRDSGNNPPPAEVAQADARMGIANALEKLIDENAPNQKTLKEFQQARQRMAQIYDHDRAINYANQSVDPQVYAKLLNERKGAMTGVGADIGKVAATFPDIMNTQSPAAQQMPRVARSGLASAGGALLGGAVGGYPGAIAGASAAGAAGWTGTQLAAKKMTKPSYQAARAMPKDYRPRQNMLGPVQQNQNALAR